MSAKVLLMSVTVGIDDGSLDERYDSSRCIASAYEAISIKTLGDAKNEDETQYMVPNRFTLQYCTIPPNAGGKDTPEKFSWRRLYHRLPGSLTFWPASTFQPVSFAGGK